MSMTASSKLRYTHYVSDTEYDLHTIYSAPSFPYAVHIYIYSVPLFQHSVNLVSTLWTSHKKKIKYRSSCGEDIQIIM